MPVGTVVRFVPQGWPDDAAVRRADSLQSVPSVVQVARRTVWFLDSSVRATSLQRAISHGTAVANSAPMRKPAKELVGVGLSFYWCFRQAEGETWWKCSVVGDDRGRNAHDVDEYRSGIPVSKARDSKG